MTGTVGGVVGIRGGESGVKYGVCGIRAGRLEFTRKEENVRRNQKIKVGGKWVMEMG